MSLKAAFSSSSDEDEDYIQYRVGRLRILQHTIAELLACAETADRHEFAKMVSKSQDVLDVEDVELARAFGVSRPTIGRWKREETAPHALMKKAILTNLAKQLQKRLNRHSNESNLVP